MDKVSRYIEIYISKYDYVWRHRKENREREFYLEKVNNMMKKISMEDALEKYLILLLSL